MSDSADISDIDALGDLKAGFGRFGEEVSQTIPSVERQLEDIQAWLDERKIFWQQQADEAEHQVHAVRRALANCEDEGYYDDEGDYQAPNCDSEEDDVRVAKRHQAKCEENLETILRWRHRIEIQVADLQNDLHRFANLVSERIASAQIFLGNKIEILGRYVGGNLVPSSDNAIPFSADALTSVLSGKNTTQLQNKEKNDTIENGFERAKLGHASRVNYKITFFTRYPDLKSYVVVHHAVPQYVLRRYGNLVTKSEIHSLENLRGIPKAINSDFHISFLNAEWNRFYRENPTTTKGKLLEKAAEIDRKYGHNFLPPTGIKNL